MSKVNGIYAATMSILGDDLSLNVKKTIEHGENLIKQGCHGVVFFGSTGQSQLIQISEKLNCINELSKSNFKNQFILGTGLNSLNETITISFILIQFLLRIFPRIKHIFSSILKLSSYSLLKQHTLNLPLPKTLET